MEYKPFCASILLLSYITIPNPWLWSRMEISQDVNDYNKCYDNLFDGVYSNNKTVGLRRPHVLH